MAKQPQGHIRILTAEQITIEAVAADRPVICSVRYRSYNSRKVSRNKRDRISSAISTLISSCAPALPTKSGVYHSVERFGVKVLSVHLSAKPLATSSLAHGKGVAEVSIKRAKRADRLLRRIEKLVPRRHREGLLSDIWDDVNAFRGENWTERQLVRYIWWQVGWLVLGRAKTASQWVIKLLGIGTVIKGVVWILSRH